jgi:hypothetical protein
MWIVTRLNAFGITFLAGLFAGFALGLHAVRADIGPWVLGAVALVALAGSWRDGRRRGAKAGAPSAPLPTPRAALAAHPTSAATDDAQAALVSLGYGAREARDAVAEAVTSLGDDADASTIVRAALRSRSR